MVRDRQYEADYGAFLAAQARWGEDGFAAVGLDYSPLMTILVRFVGVEECSLQWADNRERLLRLYDALTEDMRRQYPIVAASPAKLVGYCGNVIGNTEDVPPGRWAENYTAILSATATDSGPRF